MEQITSITDSAKQKMTIVINSNAGSFEFYLYFMPTQYSWYYDFTYKNYISRGNKVVLGGNSLRHLRKILPFGIMFKAEGNIEPFKQDDFSTQRVKMYVLDTEDVKEMERIVYE